MLLILFLTICQFSHTDTIETKSTVSTSIDGFTLGAWNEKLIVDQFRQSIVKNLNKFCKARKRCKTEYNIDNVEIVQINQCNITSICMDISLNKPKNHTSLLRRSVAQSKYDIVSLYETKLLTSTEISNQNFVMSRTSRLLLALLGIFLVALIFAITVLCFKRIREYSIFKVLQNSRADQQTPDDVINNTASVSARSS